MTFEERLSQLETSNMDLRAATLHLIQITEQHQQNFETLVTEIREIKLEIREMQLEIRGLQTENRRIIDRLFDQNSGQDSESP